MLEIIHKIVKLAQKVDCHADKSDRNDKTAEAVDCHALPCGKSRNDRKNATFKKVDSSTAQIPSLRGGGEATNEAIHKDKAQKSGF